MTPIEQGGLTPEEKARLTKSITGKELAPSTRQQSAEYANWRAIADAPADPFNVERIPISRLRQMRRDPMIAFALHFVKTPMIRAPWYIRCEEAQIAAFVDYSLRRIYDRLVMQYMLSLDFGFAAIAKKFIQEPILATYFDPNDPDKQESPDNFLLPSPETRIPSELQGATKPIWSEGAVLPTIWKPFVPLAPEDVEVIFNNQGEFDGIKFTPRFQVTTTGGSSKGSNEGDLNLDVYHSLWITNDRDSMFGNVFGYPRIGHAYNYWWSYWHHHALSDAHFEKDSDPPTIVRHPEGNYQNPDTSEIIPYRELALDIGDRVRSGSTIALPSDVYSNFEDRPSNTYKWDIDFLRGGGNFEAFIESFDYLNVMKLRAVWVPEQALIEGKGGQSSRNVADTFGDAFQESQAVLLAEFDRHINQFVIPQLVAINFPEFEGEAVKVTRGFSNKDVETMRQLIQLIGQRDLTQLPVDSRQLMEDVGIPLLDPANQAANLRQAAAENIPGAVPAVPGQQAGIVPTPGTNAPPGNPTAQLPFSYVQPPERIEIPTAISLADTFLANLPNSQHYEDKIMRQYAHQIYTEFRSLYKSQYEEFFDWVIHQELELADDNLELAIPDRIKRLVGRFHSNQKAWASAVANIRNLYRKALDRAGRVSLSKHGLKTNWSADDLKSSEAISAQVTRLVNSVASTIQDDLVRNTALALADMEEPSPSNLVNELRDRFADYPDWQAARVARTEIRDLFNTATLLAGESAGVNQVQVVDAQFGKTDSECEDRNGDIMSIVDAHKLDEHPNGTLAFRLLATDNLHIETGNEQQNAKYVPETQTIYMSHSYNGSDRKRFLLALGETLAHGD